MMRFRYRYLVPLVLLCLTGIVADASAYDLEGKVLKYTLKNGLKVLMVERHLSPTVSLYIRHRVGAVDDGHGKTGTAHFLEHLLFKGTKTIGTRNERQEDEIRSAISAAGKDLDRERGKGEKADQKQIEILRNRLEALQKRHKLWFISNEIDRLYTENGGVNLNASTGQDLTTYQVSLPANKIELWARIEADRMTDPVFREFYEERDVIMEERRQRIESDPGGKLYEQFLSAAFIAHPYRRPILGWSSDMKYLDPETLTSFFKRYHAPSNTVIAVVGDINPAATLKIIEKYFGPLPREEIDSLPVTEEPPQAGERRIEVHLDAGPELIIGYHKPTLPAFDDYVFDVIETILTKGRTSRFFRVIVEEKGIAESIQTSSSIPGSRYPNLFAVFATPRTPHTAEELEQAIYLEIERLKTEPISAKELEKVKTHLQADFIRGLESAAGLASQLSYYEALMGDYRYLTEHLKVIEKITAKEVMEAARKYLVPENRTVATLVRKSR